MHKYDSILNGPPFVLHSGKLSRTQVSLNYMSEHGAGDNRLNCTLVIILSIFSTTPTIQLFGFRAWRSCTIMVSKFKDYNQYAFFFCTQSYRSDHE